MSKDEDRDKWKDLEDKARSSAPSMPEGAMADRPPMEPRDEPPEPPKPPQSSGCSAIALVLTLAMTALLLSPALAHLLIR